MDLSERHAMSRAPSTVPMEPGLPRHPWELARAAFFLDELDREHAVSASSRVLDIGSGDAYVGTRIVERWPGATVVAWDHAYSDDEIARLTQSAIRATRDKPDGTFDLVLMLDVLEHADDEQELLRAALSALAPGGRVLVSVPAWPQLLSSHDMRLRHRRRYTPRAARALLEENGFILVRSGGLFHSLVLPRAVTSAVETRLGRSSLLPVPLRLGRGVVRSVLSSALAVDTRVSRWLSRAGVEAPGLSWWAICMRGAA
jgi:SAM-dependent methyltransferase